jgi:hypothetical protein
VISAFYVNANLNNQYSCFRFVNQKSEGEEVSNLDFTKEDDYDDVMIWKF